jgi:hypothetical protein
VGGEPGPVEGGVGALQPRRTGVAVVGEGPLRQFRIRRAFRVQPVAPELLQAAGSRSDLRRDARWV